MARKSENIPATEVLDEHEAAEVLGLAVKTLRAWRSAGTGPPFLKYGSGRFGSVRYRRSDLLAFQQAAVVEPGA